MAKIRFYDRADHCVAVIHIPLSIGGQATVAGVGDGKVEALAKAASIAKRIADDPVMSALMPPQARAAIVAARGLAAAAGRGLPVLKSFWKRIKGPGKKRLAAALIADEKKQIVGELGWNPFKRKRKPARRAPMSGRRTMPPPRMPAPEPEPMDDAQYDDDGGSDEAVDTGGES